MKLIDFVCHSTLGSRVMKEKKDLGSRQARGSARDSAEAKRPLSSEYGTYKTVKALAWRLKSLQLFKLFQLKTFERFITFQTFKLTWVVGRPEVMREVLQDPHACEGERVD